MERGSTLILRGAVIILCMPVIAFLGLTLVAIYKGETGGLYLPLLLGGYLSMVPFFVAIYETFKLLGYIDSGNAFSNLTVAALRSIKTCGIAFSSIYVLGMPLIYYIAERDDAPGLILFGMVFVLASAVVATFASLLERILHDALAIKSENELTV